MINLNFKPFPVFETKRLKLIQISKNHIQDLYELLSDPLVAEYDYFYPVEDLLKVETFINRYSEEVESNSEITWGIWVEETNELIGTCCLGNFDEKSKRSEIGYAIKRKEWNKGYATEALAAIIEYGFNEIELNRIEATITPGNDSSIKVLEKLNFRKEGHVRERDYLKGQLVDGIIMGLLKREYPKL
jgi:ribosomal-protein-alanine N-acetyltransferase